MSDPLNFGTHVDFPHESFEPQPTIEHFNSSSIPRLPPKVAARHSDRDDIEWPYKKAATIHRE